jgi:hypothetical protein
MRSLSSPLVWSVASLSLLGWGERTAQAQPTAVRATVTVRGLYPPDYSRYYYYSPYSSGYYTIASPGFRSYYDMPGAVAYYQPTQPRYYPTPGVDRSPGIEGYTPPAEVPVTPPRAPDTATSPESPQVYFPSEGTRNPTTPTGNTAASRTGTTPAPVPSYSPPNLIPYDYPGPSSYAPPNNGQGNYPSSSSYFIPDVRRDGDPGPYWYYKADLNRFYYNPRDYTVNKTDVDREYLNPRSPRFFAPSTVSTRANYYHIPGMSTFYIGSTSTAPNR